MSDKFIKWVSATCIVCKESFKYPKGNYKPATCGKFDCVQAHHFGTTRGKGAIDKMLDKAEKEA